MGLHYILCGICGTIKEKRGFTKNVATHSATSLTNTGVLESRILLETDQLT